MECFNGAGTRLFAAPLSAATPALTTVIVAPNGKYIAVAARDGQLGLFDGKGKRLWITGGIPESTIAQWKADTQRWQDMRKVYLEATLAWTAETALWPAGSKLPDKPHLPPAPAQPKPDPYLAGAFSTDGKLFYAVSASQLLVYNVANGKLVNTIDGVDGARPIAQRDAKLYFADAGARLRTFSLADGKLGAPVSLPGSKIHLIGLHAASEGIAVATDTDYTLRFLKDLHGPLDEQTAWSSVDNAHIVKHAATANGLTAVGYWGGLLRIFDGNGKVVSSRQFPQDIANLTWLGDTPIVALTDGVVMGLGIR